MKNREALGLNLLKTIAIISVVIYHIDKGLLPGGFIGVDLFFVVSGYLLALSMSKNYDTSLKDIFVKRFRQLWPGLICMIFIVMIYITLFNKPVMEHSRYDAITGISFMSNWGFIFRNVGYFDNFIVNPFKHLWYMAVLMQSFLLINILFRGFGRLNIFNKYNVFLILMMVIAVGSFILQNVLYDSNNVSRVYYGTDTRIYSIIIGVLGYYFRPIEFLKSKPSTKRFLIINIVGFISLAGFIFFILNASEFYSWVYRFGFLLFALNSLLLIYTIGSDSHILTKIFTKIKILLLPGKYSYGIYIWHYPIIMLSQTVGELARPNIYLTFIRLFFIIIISSFSFRLVESPINKLGLKNTIEKNGWTIIFKSLLFYPFVILFIMGISGIAFPYTSTAFIDKTRDVILNDELVTNNKNNLNKDTNQGTNTIETIIEDDKKVNTDTKNINSSIIYDKIILIGDSLGVNIGEKLLEIYPNSIIDAKISRQLYMSFAITEQYKKYDSERTAVIFSLGTNGMFTEEHLDTITSILPKAKKIFFTIKAPVAWERKANDLLKEYDKKKEDVVVIDWYKIANEHPEYLAQDRTHLVDEGVEAIIKEIEKELRK